MKLTRLILLSIMLLLFIENTFSQLRGQILKAGDGTIDSNGDGFVSLTSAGFSIDGYYVDEFELKMFGIPIYEEGEVLNDIQAGALCGTTDLAVDTAGYSVYGVLENNNLIFRFRLAGDNPSVEAYTILIDTDNKIGNDDPNATPENPGFEIDITFIKRSNAGVYIYDIDGIEDCPAPIAFFPYSTHYQKAIAGTNSCDDPDYFYDFYIPFAALNTLFGLTAQSELRFASVTNVSATCAMAGMISDIGGVNDADYTNNSDAFLDLTSNQCPTALEDLCQTCAGFKSGKTPKPSINTPIKVGESIITGTAVKNADVFINRFDVSSVLVESITTSSGTSGIWEATFATPLALGDSITARALLEGQCSSGISDSDLSFALVIVNTPPTINASTTALVYTENDPPINLFSDLSINDPDDFQMDEAWINFTVNYIQSEDIITLPPGQGLTLSFDPVTGEVHITGVASLAVYQSVINGIQYSNSSENPSVATRTFTVKVFDGLDESNILTRDIQVINVNDPPVLSGTAGQITYFEGDANVIVDNGILITDIDHTTLQGATVSISNNYIDTEDQLIFVDQNGITGNFDAVTGVLTLTGVSSIGNYQTALQSVEYSNSASIDPILLVNPLTRQISFQVNDGIDLSNITSRGIDMASTNSPPVVVDDMGNPIDTLWVSTLEDIPIDVCLDVVDPDGDAVDIISYALEFGQGTVDLDPLNRLCFTFTPAENYNGFEYIDIDVCDEATPSLCDDIVVAIEIIPVNDEPVIVDPENNNPIDTLFFETNEDQPIDICLEAIDPENDPLELADAYSTGMNATIDIFDPVNLCFTYSPNQDYNGTDILEVVVCEVGSTTQCDTIIAVGTVLPVNDPPQITIGGVPVDTLYFDVLEDIVTKLCVDVDDPDGDFVDLVDASPIEGYGGAFEHLPLGDLCFFFAGDTNETGTTFGEIVVCDAQVPALCDTAVVVINILPVNDPPQIISEDLELDTLRLATNEDIPINFCFRIQDPDPESEEEISINSQTSLGSYTEGTGPTECFLFTPNENIFGTEYATLSVCDNGTPTLCDLAIIEITINPVNDKPVAVNDTVVVQRNSSVSGNLTDNDYDVESSVLIINTNPENAPLHGNVTLSPDGSFTYKPFPTYSGIDAFTYLVCDDDVEPLCAGALVYIVVEDIPIIVYEAVSPNGDGMNDTWRVEGIELFPNNFIRIYDRYNNLVFQTNSYNNQERAWFGQSNKGISNKSVPEGSYFYMINLGDGSKPLSGYLILKKE